MWWEYQVPAWVSLAPEWISAIGVLLVTGLLVYSQWRAGRRHEELARRQLIATLAEVRARMGEREIPHSTGLSVDDLDSLIRDEVAKDKILQYPKS